MGEAWRITPHHFGLNTSSHLIILTESLPEIPVYFWLTQANNIIAQFLETISKGRGTCQNNPVKANGSVQAE
jgi:hypothetical protein